MSNNTSSAVRSTQAQEAPADAEEVWRMISKGKYSYLIKCDTRNCDAVIDTETKNFATALEKFRQSDWRTYKQDGKWRSSCHKCVVDYARSKQTEEGWS